MKPNWMPWGLTPTQNMYENRTTVGDLSGLYEPEDDPDVALREKYPDLYPFPSHRLNPHAIDPWSTYHYHPGTVLIPIGAIALEKAAKNGRPFGLLLSELMRLDMITAFTQPDTWKDTKRICLAYPINHPDGMGLRVLGSQYVISMVSSTEDHWTKAEVLARILFRLFQSLAREYARLLDIPAPPACAEEGCFDLARFKMIESGCVVRLVCLKHLDHSAPARTSRVWALHQLRADGKIAEAQLGLGSL